MNYRKRHAIPNLGVGVGFRTPHYAHVLESSPKMDWFEVVSENFMVRGGRPIANLDKLCTNYPVIPHGVALSIGSTHALDLDYLARLKSLIGRTRAPWCSDHLCWTGTATLNAHDLLPLPLTHEALNHVVERVKRVQGFLETPFALENASSYLTFQEDAMTEWEFLAEVSERADCGVLLDCNNVYVSAKNHGFDPFAYIDAIPADRVLQMHLAGHIDKGTYLLDTHSDHVKDDVWALYKHALRRIGPTSTLIEWDDEIPSWETLAAEAQKARDVTDEVTREDAA